MKEFMFIYLIWDIFIFLYGIVIRIFIRVSMLQKIKNLKLGKQIIFIPEFAKLEELKHSSDRELHMMYYVIFIYKIFFFTGLMTFPFFDSVK